MGLLIPASEKKRHQCDYPNVGHRGDVYWCDCGAKWKCHGVEWLRHFRWFGPPKYLLDSEGGAGPKPSEARVPKPTVGPKGVRWTGANGRSVSPPLWAGRRVPPTMEPPSPPPPPKYATGGPVRARSFLDVIHSYALFGNGLYLTLTDAKKDRSTTISDSPFLIEVHFDASSEVMGISIIRLDTVA